MLYISMPASFPYKSNTIHNNRKISKIERIQKIDFIGASLLLAASVLLVSALEEGGTEYSWTSAVVLSLLLISLALWFLFFWWQKYQINRQGMQEPILPWRLLQDRFVMGLLL